ncbi:Predicted arabinose efflux permease, MFS family [Desulfuromusa kysingii]|uniref:Predicted arabinose efflux permease, MFS family n=2 Tax=Desulfuromusa kysingii TaxID=37625 RepID=A0A1H4A4C9_9BACT|nr:Predicted arabinose efflux permease, MFS family [Desulfuromusa kysingii]
MAKKRGFLAAVAALGVYLLAVMTGIISPGLAALAQAYPELEFTTIVLAATLPNLIAIPVALIAGAVAGKAISFRALSLIGSGLIALGGTAPYFFHSSFNMILVSRAIFGIGFGICFTLMGTLIVRLYDGQTRDSMLGYGAATMAVGGVVLPMLVGYFVTIDTHAMWLPHLVAALSFLAVLFWLPEPDKIEEMTGADHKTRFPFAAWALIIAFTLTTMAVWPMMLGIATVIVGEGLGTAVTAGMAISMFAAGNFIGGLVFGQYAKITGRHALPVALLICAGGMSCLAFGGLLMIMVGTTLIGFGFIGVGMPAIFGGLGQMLSPSAMAMAGGLVAVANNLGAFVAGYWMPIAMNVTGSTSPRGAYTAGIVVLLAVAVFVWFTQLSQKQQSDAAVASA